MGARDDRSAPEEPRVGVIERWMALREERATKANTASGANTASEEAVPGGVSAPPEPLATRQGETVPGPKGGSGAPDPVLMARIAALRAAEDEGSAPDPETQAAFNPSEPVTGSLK